MKCNWQDMLSGILRHLETARRAGHMTAAFTCLWQAGDARVLVLLPAHAVQLQL